MSKMLLFYITTSIFGIIYIILALLPRKQIKTKTDYFLAGRGLDVFKATCTLIATQLGAGLLLGTSQKAFEIGLYSLLFTGGICIGLIILGLGVAGRLRELDIVTTTEIFETKYHSPVLRKLGSLIVTFTLCGILVGNMVASSSLLASLGLHNTLFYTFFWLFIILYTMIGGLHAVVLTDIVQVLFIVITFVGITLYSLYTLPHDFSIEALKSVQHLFTGHLPDLNTLIVMLLMPALFALFEQDLAQIFFASKTKRVATLAAIATTIFILTFGFIPIYFGMKAHLLGVTVAGNQSPLLTMIEKLTNSFVVVIIASGILAAIASTADALLCAIGANLDQDFSFKFLHLSPLIESKVIILVMGLLILGISYFMPTDIISILVKSYEVPVSCLLIPVLAAYMFDSVKRYAGLGGFFGGAFGLLIFKAFIPVEFNVLYILGLSFIGYMVGFFMEGKSSPVKA